MRRSRDPEVFLTIYSLCTSVQSALFVPVRLRQLGMSLFSTARPTKYSADSPLCPRTLDFFLFYSLWPGTGWPGLGLPGQTPPDPSHHPHQTGTAEATHHWHQKSFAFVRSSKCACCETLEAGSTYRQHQHSTRRSGNAIGTRKTRATGRTLMEKTTKMSFQRTQCKEN